MEVCYWYRSLSFDQHLEGIFIRPLRPVMLLVVGEAGTGRWRWFLGRQYCTENYLT